MSQLIQDGMSMEQLVRLHGIEDETYDTALPQDWVDHVILTTKLNPFSHFVWLYDEKAHLFGRPFPLDGIGIEILAKMGKGR
jgi:hypothetical protein